MKEELLDNAEKLLNNSKQYAQLAHIFKLHKDCQKVLAVVSKNKIDYVLEKYEATIKNTVAKGGSQLVYVTRKEFVDFPVTNYQKLFKSSADLLDDESHYKKVNAIFASDKNTDVVVVCMNKNSITFFAGQDFSDEFHKEYVKKECTFLNISRKYFADFTKATEVETNEVETTNFAKAEEVEPNEKEDYSDNPFAYEEPLQEDTDAEHAPEPETKKKRK